MKSVNNGEQLPTPVRVVLAEPTPLIRHALERELAAMPTIEVVGQTASASEVVALVRRTKPHVVTLDLELPDGGGMVVIHDLQSIEPPPQVLVLTSVTRPATFLASLGAGARGYMTHGVSGSEVAQAILELAAGHSVIAPELAPLLIDPLAGGEHEAIGGTQSTLLTPVELDLIRLVGDGCTDREIARRLFISPRTVQNHLSRIRGKAGVVRRAEVVRWASENQLV